MPLLSRHYLATHPLPPAVATCGPLTAFPERVIQFGEGNFLRAFADWMIDALNERGLFQGSVVVVQPIRQGAAAALNAQDGLFTVVPRGLRNGAPVEQRRIVTAISRALDPYADWDAVRACVRAPALRICLSNTTEAGIAYVEAPFDPDRCPESFPAKVAALLYERFRAFDGDPARGLLFLPCELIEHNGRTLRAYVLRHAASWGLGDAFRDWVLNHNPFLDTLVDRIVPGFPTAEAGPLAAALGYEDRLLVATEDFHLWVIEGPAALAAELPLQAAGLNVVWTDDLGPYRTRKVRVLNGAHTASVLAAFHAGIDTVRDMLADDLFHAFLRQAVFAEILPVLPFDPREREAYATAVLERFANPFIRHNLLSIALNSVSKWRVRVLPSLLDYVATHNRLPPALTFSLAALLFFYRGVRAPDGTLQGSRQGAPYPILDEPAALAGLEALWHALAPEPDPRAAVATCLADAALWGRDLAAIPGFADAVAAHLQRMLRDGMRAAAAAVIAAGDAA